MKQKPKVRYLVDKSQALAPVISHMNSAHNPHSLLPEDRSCYESLFALHLGI